MKSINRLNLIRLLSVFDLYTAPVLKLFNLKYVVILCIYVRRPNMRMIYFSLHLTKTKRSFQKNKLYGKFNWIKRQNLALYDLSLLVFTLLSNLSLLVFTLHYQTIAF